MKQIVVNDTNVFIDLLEVGLLDKFFLLSWEIHTTDFVMLELRIRLFALFQTIYQQNYASYDRQKTYYIKRRQGSV